MTISRTKVSYKQRINPLCIILFSILFSTNTFAQFVDLISLNSVSADANSGEKPQSKVWEYNGEWWAVIPTSGNTYLHHLSTDTWIQGIKLSNKSNVNADTKAVGDITYILLFDNNKDEAEFVRIQFSAGTGTYSIITGGPGSEILITLDPNVETATIDVDSNNKVWLASDEKITDIDSRINVRYSVGPNYTTWSLATTLANDIMIDDICTITAFTTSGVPKIGVLWSNQNDHKFYFSYRLDSEDPATAWHGPEVASPGQTGNFSDDHINLAVSTDGTIYAAVKTSYDSEGLVTIALLVRDGSSSTWSIYNVTNSGATRPIALLYTQGSQNFIIVFYTKNSSSADDIVYKYSNISSISFLSQTLLDSTTTFNNVTSTKQICYDDAVILYSHGKTWYGNKAGGALPVELAFFNGILNGAEIELNWRTDNYGFNIERSLPSQETIWNTIGFVEGHGNSNSPKDYNFIDSEIDQSGNYSYRLKQIDNDGTFEYSDVVTVSVGTPERFYLSQNYPNPFNPTTTIDYMISKNEKVSLKVYDLLGREVVTLVNEFKPAGTYSVSFDAEDLASGVYIYRLIAGEYVAVKRMSLLK